MKPRVRASWWELAAVGIAQQEPELLREAVIAKDAKMIPGGGGWGGGRAGLLPSPSPPAQSVPPTSQIQPRASWQRSLGDVAVTGEALKGREWI